MWSVLNSFNWQTAAVGAAVALLMVFVGGPALERYVLMPLVARMRRGAWAKDRRYWAHAEHMRALEARGTLDAPNTGDDDEVPDLIPADPAELCKGRNLGPQERRRLKRLAKKAS